MPSVRGPSTRPIATSPSPGCEIQASYTQVVRGPGHLFRAIAISAQSIIFRAPVCEMSIVSSACIGVCSKQANGMLGFSSENLHETKAVDLIFKTKKSPVYVNLNVPDEGLSKTN